jgi:hypothetical protein
MRRSILASLAISLCGCTSSVSVSEVDPGTEAVDGIPFRVREPMVVEIYSVNKGADGSAPIEVTRVATELMSVANPERLYVLHFRGLAFSNGTLETAHAWDGALTKVATTTENQAPETLTALSGELTSVSKFLAERDAAREAERAAERQEQLMGFDAELAYQEAVAAVAKAQALFNAAPAGTAQQEMARADLLLAQAKANDKAIRAGRTQPFANVGF